MPRTEYRLSGADSTLKIAKDCQASGYSWWYYQDYYWGNPHDCFNGLLGRDTVTYETEKKPVVEAFEAFIPASPPGTMTRPASFYDPYHHEQYAPGTHIITGHIIDKSGPVQDAWIRGITYLGPDPQHPDDTLYDSHYTFSDTNGFFKLIPYDYLGTTDTSNRILDLKITSPSGSRLHYGWTQAPSVIDSGLTYTLYSNDWEYFRLISDSVIVGPGNLTIQAYNELELQDIVFQQGSDVDIMARSSISLHSDVFAKNGSETHIYCFETFPQCAMIPDFTGKEKSMINADTPNPTTNQIELIFLSLIDSVGIIIFPNPCGNSLTLEILNSADFPPPYFVEIFSNLGIRTHSHHTEQRRSIIAVESLSPGIYFIKISANDKSFVKCFIKN